MRLSILTLTAGVTLFVAGTVVAQDQGTAEGTPLTDLMGPEAVVSFPVEEAAAPAEDFFKLGEAVVVNYDPLDIDEAIDTLAEQVCGKNGLAGCQFNSFVVTEIREANEARLIALINAKTEITRLRAETEVAKHRWIAAEAIRKANEAEMAAGIAYSADDMASVMADISELADSLNRLSVLVEGSPDSTDAGLDQEVASLAERIYALEETINTMMANSNVLAEAMLNFCSVNQDVSWCRMMSSSANQ